MSINEKIPNDKIPNDKIQSKQDMLMNTLKEFFLSQENIAKMVPIIKQKSKISLRLLDWFVTNYAKKKNIGYFVKSKKKDPKTNQIIQREQYFNVYLNYKSQLKAYSKQLFDPFCRKWKITKPKKVYCAIHFYYKKDKYIETTAGQLNFFRWVIQNNVLEYAIDKITDIQRDMLLFAKKKNRVMNQSQTNPKDEHPRDQSNQSNQSQTNQLQTTQQTTQQINPTDEHPRDEHPKDQNSNKPKDEHPRDQNLKDEILITMTAVAIKNDLKNQNPNNLNQINDKNANRKIMKNQINITVDFN